MTRSSPFLQPARRSRRRRRMTTRLLPVLALAAAAFVGGAVAGSRVEGPQADFARRYAAAWSQGDYAAMHDLLSPAARERTSLRRFVRLHQAAARTATLTALRVGRPAERDGDWALPVVAHTRVFGTLRGTVLLPFTGEDDAAAIDWQPHLVFPGLRPGERLSRHMRLPSRADILTRDGEPIAKGPDRLSELGAIATTIAGGLGPIPREGADHYEALGFPADATVGVSGLEREFDERLAGHPGGTLRAGQRVLARARAHKAAPLRVSVSADMQRAAVGALGAQYGGVAVLKPLTGEVLALAGIAASAAQPPGSTMKLVTTSGALAAGIVKPSDTFPVQTEAVLSGVKLENANGEACGGSLETSFAESCNSVFAPIGARLGAKRLVATAERFGFNQPPPLAFAAQSTLPKAEEIGDDLAVGSSAIGQGKVLATPLQMASVAATIAARGMRHKPTLERAPDTHGTRVVSARVARLVRRFMIANVERGTGTAAQIPGVTVAGKTGTAELRTTQGKAFEEKLQQSGEQLTEEERRADTDAWFVAFAPAGKPRVVVAVLLVGAGQGGASAAPVGREVLLAGLKATR